ncbi:sugar/nucleoside kinase (ribokinase family) [Murinocardiopsis flavida]|uniref:Sugar/nucleoside kinase (Ribokinase family) n=1 Tax=Murinocardiopsis flavida TaxID=645275 RepID=A0A2P8CY58_9ACTN|nr:carbohydrate kinase family protein [Murinocardiopsis flavida]PSK89899.1 sugar/nucleoside kinase (ribokinase family) [Murinocardiopsis flavida]
MDESPHVVVAGVASLGIVARVGAPGPDPARIRFAEWMEAGVTGVGANVAKTLRALGARVELCTVIGTDIAGAAIRADLEAYGLLGAGAVEGDGSSLAMSLTGDGGQHTDLALHQQVNQVKYPGAVFERLGHDADLVVLSTAAFTEELVGVAGRLGVPVAFDAQVIADVNDPRRAKWLQVADIVFCSHRRLPCPPKEWIAQMFAAYPGCLITAIGCGALGAVMGLADGTLVRAVTEAPRPVVNTLGAGDTLFPTFLHSWLSAGNPVRALGEAVVHASYKVGDGFPSRGHLDAAALAGLMASHPVRISLDRWAQ